MKQIISQIFHIPVYDIGLTDLLIGWAAALWIVLFLWRDVRPFLVSLIESHDAKERRWEKALQKYEKAPEFEPEPEPEPEEASPYTTLIDRYKLVRSTKDLPDSREELRAIVEDFYENGSPDHYLAKYYSIKKLAAELHDTEFYVPYAHALLSSVLSPEPNTTLALEYLHEARKNKDPEACYILGDLSMSGTKVPFDPERSEMLFVLAKEYGHKEAQERLELLVDVCEGRGRRGDLSAVKYLYQHFSIFPASPKNKLFYLTKYLFWLMIAKELGDEHAAELHLDYCDSLNASQRGEQLLRAARNAEAQGDRDTAGLSLCLAAAMGHPESLRLLAAMLKNNEDDLDFSPLQLPELLLRAADHAEG